MKYTLEYLANPEVFAVNRIEAHSDHKFYADINEADNNCSSLIQNLNGTWKFSWAKIRQKEKKVSYPLITAQMILMIYRFRDTLNFRDMENLSM